MIVGTLQYLFSMQKITVLRTGYFSRIQFSSADVLVAEIQ